MRSIVVALSLAVGLVACSSAGDDTAVSDAQRSAPSVESAATDARSTTVGTSGSEDGKRDTSSTTAPSTVAPALPDDGPAAPRCAVESGSTDVELVVWHALGSDAEAKFDELVATFNEQSAGPTVRVERRGNYTETVQDLAATDPEEWPDVVMADHRSVQVLFDSAMTVPPGECGIRFDDLLPVIRATYSLDGDLQAVPFNVSTPVLLFDVGKVRGAGLDPASPPATLGQLSDAAREVVATGMSAHGFVAYDHYGAWFVRQFDNKRGVVTGAPDNGRMGDRLFAVDFTRPEIVESYEWLRDEVEAGRALWIGGNPSGIDDLLRLVDPVADATYTITTSGAVGEVLRVVESGAFGEGQVGVAPMPGPGPGGAAGGGAFWVFDRGDPVRVGAAHEFLRWLVEPAQHAGFAGYTGFSPLRESELDDPDLVAAWAEHPQLRVGYDQLRGVPGDVAHAGPAWGLGEEITALLYATITRVVEGRDAAEELALATEQANALIADYNDGS